MDSNERQPQSRFYWDKITDGQGAWIGRAGKEQGPPGEDLAAMRSGIGRLPGTVPRMWPHHVVIVPDEYTTARSDSWRPPSALEAEHHALTLYAVHQQGQSIPMHRTGEGTGLGAVMRALRQAEERRAAAMDRRFAAAVTATSMSELAVHLRGLIKLLKTLDQPQPLDYSQLFKDLRGWAMPSRRPVLRRRWGIQYFAWAKRDDEEVVSGVGD